MNSTLPLNNPQTLCQAPQRASVKESRHESLPFMLRAHDQGLGFRVEGLGFGVWGLGFKVWGLGFRVRGLGFRVWGFGLLLRV